MESATLLPPNSLSHEMSAVFERLSLLHEIAAVLLPEKILLRRAIKSRNAILFMSSPRSAQSNLPIEAAERESIYELDKRSFPIRSLSTAQKATSKHGAR